MNIQAFRKKFILIAMTAMTACLLILLTLINVISFYRTFEEQTDILTIISENDGSFPSFNAPMLRNRSHRSYQITEESEHQVRYFQVAVHSDGSISNINLQRIAAINEDEAIAIGQKAAAMGREYGFIGDYIFKAQTRQGGDVTYLYFLDWQEQQASLKSFFLISVMMGLLGLAATFLIVVGLSRRAIRPVIVSSQKQQQFITDASHELKTPLSVISVNMDVLSLEVGENEWITSTNEQIKSLRMLVNQLISAARMDETASIYMEKQPLDLSEIITDTVSYFAPIAEAAGRTFEMDIPAHMELCGNEELLRRLVSVLCDNAIKHAEGEGNIKLSLSAKGKTAVLCIQNPWPRAKDPDVYERMFDRFYKMDPARNKHDASTGFGIGLSIAEKAAQWHGGSIRAYPVDTDKICFQISLRIK